MMAMINALRTALMIVLIQSAAVQRNAGASIEGTVSDITTGRPIAGAVVELTGIAEAGDWRVLSFSTVTSADGRFEINGVPPGGAYQLVATGAPDFAAAVYDQKRPEDPWTPISLTAGQRVTGVRIVLKAFSSISGHVVDKEGKAVRNLTVAALQAQYRDGQRVLQTSQRTATNDRGEYRIPGLTAGRYVIRTGPAKGSSSTLPNKAVSESANPYTYYPDAIDPDNAVSVEVAEAADVGGVNFVAAQTATRRVRGIVRRAATGNSVQDTLVFLVPPRTSPDSNVTRRFASSSGEFDFRGVAPGVYQLFAVAEGDAGRPMSGRIGVNVGNADLRDIRIDVRPDVDVAGRVVFDDPAVAVGMDLSQLVVTLDAENRGTVDGNLYGLVPEKITPAVAPPVQSTPARDGTFRLRGLRSWLYFANANVKTGTLRAGNIYVKSIRLGSTDVLRDGQPFDPVSSGILDIVLAADSGFLDGRVLDENRNGMPHSTVVLVPDEPFRNRRDRYRTTKTDFSGNFSLLGIPPGNYKVFAWRGIETDAWFFPEFLRPYENKAVPVTIRPDGKEYVETPLLPAVTVTP